MYCSSSCVRASELIYSISIEPEDIHYGICLEISSEYLKNKKIKFVNILPGNNCCLFEWSQLFCSIISLPKYILIINWRVTSKPQVVRKFVGVMITSIILIVKMEIFMNFVNLLSTNWTADHYILHFYGGSSLHWKIIFETE